MCIHSHTFETESQNKYYCNKSFSNFYLNNSFYDFGYRNNFIKMNIYINTVLIYDWKRKKKTNNNRSELRK